MEGTHLFLSKMSGLTFWCKEILALVDAGAAKMPVVRYTMSIHRMLA